MAILPHLLVVDDDEALLRTISRALRSHARVSATSSSDRAEAILEKEAVDGLLVDVRLPSQSGFDILALARARRPGISVLLMSGDSRYTNKAWEAGVNFVLKPVENHQLRAFANDVGHRAMWGRHALRTTLHLWSVRYDLTTAEYEILAAAVASPVREDIAESLGKGVETIKSQIRSLLHKTGHQKIGQAAVCLLREALSPDDALGDAKHGFALSS